MLRLALFGCTAFSFSLNQHATAPRRLVQLGAVREVSRRDSLSQLAVGVAAAAAAASGLPACAVASTDAPVIATGVVSLQEGAVLPAEGLESTAALYVTARTDASFRIGGKELLSSTFIDGTKGARSPPIAAYRVSPVPKLPFTIELRESDLFPEIDKTPEAPWRGLPLALSARLDLDGVAATRSGGDLVGQGFYLSKKGERPEEQAVVELKGRGLAGKLQSK